MMLTRLPDCLCQLGKKQEVSCTQTSVIWNEANGIIAFHTTGLKIG